MLVGVLRVSFGGVLLGVLTVMLRVLASVVRCVGIVSRCGAVLVIPNSMLIVSSVLLVVPALISVLLVVVVVGPILVVITLLGDDLAWSWARRSSTAFDHSGRTRGCGGVCLSLSQDATPAGLLVVQGDRVADEGVSVEIVVLLPERAPEEV